DRRFVPVAQHFLERIAREECFVIFYARDFHLSYSCTSNFSSTTQFRRTEVRRTQHTAHTLNLKCITSPSFTVYSFPSLRRSPASFTAASVFNRARSS